jgi:hypothetical protein
MANPPPRAERLGLPAVQTEPEVDHQPFAVGQLGEQQREQLEVRRVVIMSMHGLPVSRVNRRVQLPAMEEFLGDLLAEPPAADGSERAFRGVVPLNALDQGEERHRPQVVAVETLEAPGDFLGDDPGEPEVVDDPAVAVEGGGFVQGHRWPSGGNHSREVPKTIASS